MTDLIQTFETHEAHLQAAVEYLTATGQEARPVQALHATCQRAQTAMIILTAQPEETANTDFLLCAIEDIMAVIDTMLLPEAQQRVWLPNPAA